MVLRSQNNQRHRNAIKQTPITHYCSLQSHDKEVASKVCVTKCVSPRVSQPIAIRETCMIGVPRAAVA
jgi:hypothetical protein